ncbi:MAG: hypothetical protein H6702_07265 [Myxococcales bacterium]|nr:hypothetical protein [Myxococcales bacterium]
MSRAAGPILLALWLAACGSSAPPRPATYYDNGTLKAPAFSERTHKKRYQQAAAGVVKKRAVTWVDAGRPERLSPKAVGKLPMAALVAIHTASEMPKGVERDVLFMVDKKRRPVSIRVDVKGAITVEGGPAWYPDKERRDAGPIKPLLRGKWEDGMAGDLALAWDQVGEADRALLKGVTFHRVPGRHGTEGGKYIANEKGHRIEIYDATKDARERGFVGAPDQPQPRSLLTYYHEIGHGLSAFPRLEAVRRYNQTVKAANAGKPGAAKRLKALQKAVDQQQKHNPVLAAYQKTLGKAGAPTVYGATALEESFAEAYALFRGHPAALQRLRPATYKWFKGAGHRHAIQGALKGMPAAL